MPLFRALGWFKAMHTHIGLWIDHRRAVIALPSPAGGDVTVITSGVERHPSRDDDGEPRGEAFEAQQVLADDVRDRKFSQHLNAYYDEVIDLIHGAKSLLIMGPGEAKGELEKRLAHQKPAHRSVDVEPADKLTDRQVVAKVHDHFLTATPAILL